MLGLGRHSFHYVILLLSKICYLYGMVDVGALTEGD